MIDGSLFASMPKKRTNFNKNRKNVLYGEAQVGGSILANKNFCEGAITTIVHFAKGLTTPFQNFKIAP